jgi:hypothetical protein
MMNGLSLIPASAVYAWLVLGCWLAVIGIGSCYLLDGASARVRRVVAAILLAIVLSTAYGVRESDARIAYHWRGWVFWVCVC